MFQLIRPSFKGLFYLGFILNLLAFLALFVAIERRSYAALTDSPIPVSDATLGNLLKEKVRIQNYSEFMTPALAGGEIPNSKGQGLAPAMEDGRVWIDYALTPNYRILYWQRYFLFPFNDYSVYDPRFGLRLTQIFDVPGLATTYDFYFLPGISQMAKDANRFLEVGFRTNTTYSFPHSKWDLGFVSELNAPFYRQSTGGKALWGVVAPWTSYKFAKKVSTQHYFMFPIKYQQGSFAWDITGMPFVQNGIGWSASGPVWLGLFLNNYLFTAPTLKNTWMSLWINISFL